MQGFVIWHLLVSNILQRRWVWFCPDSSIAGSAAAAVVAASAGPDDDDNDDDHYYYDDYENTDDSNDDAGDDTAYSDSHDSSITKVYQIHCFQNISVFRQRIRPRFHDVTTWKKVRH